MLASINSGQMSSADTFDAYQHLLSLIRDTEITIKPTISYGRGWATLMQQFIQAVAGSQLLIKQIDAEFGPLEMLFEFQGRPKYELRVQRALLKLRTQSMCTCYQCGDYAVAKRHKAQSLIMCSACFTQMRNPGKTGTWLDEY